MRRRVRPGLGSQLQVLYVLIMLSGGLSSRLLPWRDPLTSAAPLCDSERDLHLIGLWLTRYVTVVSSVARTVVVR